MTFDGLFIGGYVWVDILVRVPRTLLDLDVVIRMGQGTLLYPASTRHRGTCPKETQHHPELVECTVIERC